MPISEPFFRNATASSVRNVVAVIEVLPLCLNVYNHTLDILNVEKIINDNYKKYKRNYEKKNDSWDVYSFRFIINTWCKSVHLQEKDN